MLYLAGIIIPIFLLIILISKKAKTVSDNILTAWLFFSIIQLVYFYCFVTKEYLNVIAFLGWELPLPLLHGPFLYLYVLSLTRERLLTYKALLHFIPFCIAYLILVPLLKTNNTDRLEVYQHLGKGYETQFVVLTIAIIASGVIYVALSLYTLWQHRRRIANRFSNTDKITLDWLRYLIYGLGAIWIFVIFYRTPQTLFISSSLFMFFIGYFGIRQVGIFSNVSNVEGGTGNRPINLPEPENEEVEIVENGESTSSKKYEKSALADEDAARIHSLMTETMQEKLLFTNAELTLTDLAKHIDVHPNTLSQVINSVENKNFYDYINELRVEEFKRIAILPENRNLTLLGLAFECGFNSKSSFNRNFKKLTNLSPSDYLKTINTESSQNAG